MAMPNPTLKPTVKSQRLPPKPFAKVSERPKG